MHVHAQETCSIARLPRHRLTQNKCTSAPQHRILWQRHAGRLFLELKRPRVSSTSRDIDLQLSTAKIIPAFCYRYVSRPSSRSSKQMQQSSVVKICSSFSSMCFRCCWLTPTKNENSSHTLAHGSRVWGTEGVAKTINPV